MQEWRGTTFHCDDCRSDGFGDGSPGSRCRRSPHGLRHVQSTRYGDGNHGHCSPQQDGREERGFPSKERSVEGQRMSASGGRSVKLLLAEDNPLVRELTKHIPFLFMASRPDIEERLRPLVDGVEDFIPKPFLVKDLVRVTKKVVDRLHLEKLQKKASRPGVIQGRLEDMSMIDLMQSLEMRQTSCRLMVRQGGTQGELYFAGGQCRDAKVGKVEGDDAVYKVVLWTEGEFEIDFNAANASTRTTTTRNTTGLLMEAMRLMDEANRDAVGTK